MEDENRGDGAKTLQNPQEAQNDVAGTPQRICKKCLLREMQEGEYFKNMYEYIAQLDPDIKADTALYEERLAACKACEHLMNGMCRVCGCFVEMRAAVKKNYCPGVEKAW